MSITRIEFAVGILEGLGIGTGWAHRGAKRALVSWMHAETGEHPGYCNGLLGEGARYNPLNTTLPWPLATDYNNVGVKNYPTARAGIAATVATLKESQYAGIVQLLALPLASAKSINRAIDASPWGSHEPLLSEALSSYNTNRSFYNNYPVGLVEG